MSAPDLFRVAHPSASPDDLRADGWMVAVHNDYRLDGVFHTFWLLTKGERALKGEGRSDGEALDRIRERLRGEHVGGMPFGGQGL